MTVEALVIVASVIAGLSHQFVMQGAARAFTATIGERCLLERDASIHVEGNIVTITGEGQACAEEVEEIARNWEIFAPVDAIVTVTGSPESLVLQREKLEAKFGKSPNPRLRFLSADQTCRCLVIAGKLSLEAADLAQSEPPVEARPSTGTHHLDPGRSEELFQDRSLIWNTGPVGVDLNNHNEI